MRFRFHSREGCPACGSAQPRTVHSSKFSEGAISVFLRAWYDIEPTILDAAPYELQRCPNCELVFQRHIGDPELMQELYTTWQAHRMGVQEEDPDPELLSPVYREHLRELNESLFAHEVMVASSFLGVPLNRMKTLDYGMGSGLWVRIAVKLGCDSYGLELSEKIMAYVRRHGAKTVTDQEIPDHKFHFVNTEQVFEHVPEPKELLKRLAASLHPGGVVKISVPSGERAGEIVSALNNGSYQGDYKTIMPVHPLEHINTYNRHSLAVMAKSAGLEQVRPSLLQSYSFLARPGAVSLRRPKKAIKELIRPWYQWRNPSNIYIWLRKRA